MNRPKVVHGDKIFSFFGFVLSLLRLNAQFEQEEMDSFHGSVLMNPLHLIYPELQISYELDVLERVSLFSRIGGKVAHGTDGSFESFGGGLWGVYEHQYLMNKYLNGLYVSTGPTFYFKGQRKYFVGCQLLYRFYWMNAVRLSFDDVETYRFNSVRTERNNVLGLKLLFGDIHGYKLTDKFSFNVRRYIGFTGRIKWYRYKNEDALLLDGSYSNYNKSGTYYWPISPFFGIDIGIKRKRQLQQLPFLL